MKRRTFLGALAAVIGAAAFVDRGEEAARLAPPHVDPVEPPGLAPQEFIDTVARHQAQFVGKTIVIPGREPIPFDWYYGRVEVSAPRYEKISASADIESGKPYTFRDNTFWPNTLTEDGAETIFWGTDTIGVEVSPPRFVIQGNRFYPASSWGHHDPEWAFTRR